jgi:hypothetical protein
MAALIAAYVARHLPAFFSWGEICRTLKANEGMGKASRLLWLCEYVGPDIGTLEQAFGPILDQQTRDLIPLESFPFWQLDAGFVFVSHVMNSKGEPQALVCPRRFGDARTEFDSFQFGERWHVVRVTCLTCDLGARPGIRAVEIGTSPVMHRSAARTLAPHCGRRQSRVTPAFSTSVLNFAVSLM